MDVATVVGILVAFGAVALSAGIGGVDLSILYERYEAFILVLGGTIGATLIAFPLKTFARGIGGGCGRHSPSRHIMRPTSSL